MKSKMKLLVLGVCMVPFVATISTYNATIGLAGPSSISYEMTDRAAALVEYAGEASSNAMNARPALEVIAPIEKSICGMADIEEKRGVFTGSPGKGALAGQLAQICLQVEAIGDSLEATIETTERNRAEIAVIADKLNDIVQDQSRDIFERKKEFERQQKILLGFAREAREERVAERLSTQLTVLENSVMTINVQEGAFGAKQAAAIDEVRNYVGTIKEAVSELFSVHSEQPTLEPPAPLHDMAGAIIKYRDRNWAAIALAVGIDTIVLWFSAALGLSLAIKQAREKALTSPSQHDSQKGTQS